MNQEERRRFLIEKLLRERLSCRRQEIPADTDRQKVLLRSLMNVRHPGAISIRPSRIGNGRIVRQRIARIGQICNV